jgi:hypothetical protein
MDVESTDPAVYHELLCSAARRLTGHQRRLFQAEVTNTLCQGSARKAERIFGWGRDCVTLGLHEAASGVRCQENFQARGRLPWEQRDERLAQDIRDLAEPFTQADPQMRSDRKYTRLTAAALRLALINDKGYRPLDVPKERTLRSILKRLGYHLKRIQKTKPHKKIKETDAIFDNIRSQPPAQAPAVAADNAAASAPPVADGAETVTTAALSAAAATLDLSGDVKAKVPLGEYSRGGETRCDAQGHTPPAWDHDPPAKKKECLGGC